MDNLCGVSKETAWQLGYVKGLSDAVRHGYWTLVKLNDWELKWECSICKSQENTENDGMGEIYDPTPYCPHCGAKMQKEED